MFFDGFVNPVLLTYTPAFVHPGFLQMLEFYGPAFVPFVLYLLLFAVGYLGLAIALARSRLLVTVPAVLLALGATVFGVALLFPEIEPIVIERIGGVPFAVGLLFLMRVEARSTTRL
jgi:hypothetical protein